MLATNCEACRFLMEGAGCAAGRFCIKDAEDHIVAPGQCRLRKDRAWEPDLDLEQAHEKAKEDLTLKFDLFVTYDEKTETITQLDKTVQWFIRSPFCNRIVIADITGQENRHGMSVSFAKHVYKEDFASGKLVVDASIDKEEKTPVSIRRLAKMSKSKYFIVLPADKIISDLDLLNDHLVNDDVRAVFWSFPTRIGSCTDVSTPFQCYGLYLTGPYKFLNSKSDDSPFSLQLIDIEKETGICLSWFFDRCKIV